MYEFLLQYTPEKTRMKLGRADVGNAGGFWSLRRILSFRLELEQFAYDGHRPGTRRGTVRMFYSEGIGAA
jgi:hypothetical protein